MVLVEYRPTTDPLAPTKVDHLQVAIGVSYATYILLSSSETTKLSTLLSYYLFTRTTPKRVQKLSSSSSSTLVATMLHFYKLV